MNDIIADLRWRGLIYQTTSDETIQEWLNSKCRTLYCGFDPTADSLHVGSLLPLLTLRRFQRAGHRPIAVVGGATGMIGDPSGKSQERSLLSADILAKNVSGIRNQMASFLDFECGQNSALLVNNFDWISPFSFITFLRDVGKNFPVNVMLTKDSVKNRLENSDVGLSYTEFSYMLLQAYDFVHLNQAHGCELQIGGSDQWGNITAGIDLGRRMHSAQLYGVTLPLLTKSDGTKMGKTESGTVWLSAERTSPYQFYQYWINVADNDVSKCLRFLTELSREEVEALDASREADSGKKESQKKLAEELTRLVHGEEGLRRALQATDALFGGNLLDLPPTDLEQVFASAPSKTVGYELLEGTGLPILDALVTVELCKSKGDARRLVEQGGVYVNNQTWADATKTLDRSQLLGSGFIVLRSGKRKFALLRFQ